MGIVAFAVQMAEDANPRAEWPLRLKGGAPRTKIMSERGAAPAYKNLAGVRTEGPQVLRVTLTLGE
jgi:hypothetical protein